MSQEQWTAVDDYFAQHLIPPDPVLDAALQAAQAAELPEIQVSLNQGQMLAVLVKLVNARRILEIGTLGGYSTLWMARAMPADGHIITLEYEPKHAEVARANFAQAGVADQIEIRVGKALDTLPQLEAEGAGPFDLVFIDADKPNNTPYFEWALKLTRRGSLIITDNVVRQGAILDPDHADERVQGVQRFFERIAHEPRVSSTALQTVGSKGWDGLVLSVVNGDQA